MIENSLHVPIQTKVLLVKRLSTFFNGEEKTGTWLLKPRTWLLKPLYRSIRQTRKQADLKLNTFQRQGVFLFHVYTF